MKFFLKGWQFPLTTPQLLLPTALSPNALKVTLSPELASLVPPNSMITVALVDRATGATAHCPVPFQLFEEENNSQRFSSLSSSSSSSSGASEEEEFLLSRLKQLLPKRSALMECGRYSASFDGSKQTSSSLSLPSPSSSSPSVFSHEIFERPAFFLDWYHGQPSLPAPNMLQIAWAEDCSQDTPTGSHWHLSLPVPKMLQIVWAEDCSQDTPACSHWHTSIQMPNLLQIAWTEDCSQDTPTGSHWHLSLPAPNMLQII